MDKLRIGMIGVGGIAQERHLPAFSKMTDLVALTAVHDIDRKRAQQVADQFDISSVVTDDHEMFSKVDAVIISTPNKFHAEIAIKALEAGVHVFCEKPMAISTKECQAMIRAANNAKKILMIGYHYRFMTEAQAAKRVVDAGEIGRPLVARVQAMRRRKVPGWGVFTNKELQGGGCLIDFGCHFIDLALWLMGNPKPIEVTGTTYNDLSRDPEKLNQWGAFDHTTFDVDDHATGYVKFENGSSLLLETSWAANVREDTEAVSLSGKNGGLDVFPFHLNQAKHGMLLNSDAYWMPGEEDPGYPQAKNFVDSCLGLAEPTVAPEEAMQTSHIIERIYKSTETGKKFFSKIDKRL